MFSKRLAPLTLLAFAAVAVPVHCSALKTLVKKDCIIALDGSCVDSIDFTASSNDFTTLPNDNLLAFNTLPTTTDPIDESFIFSDTDATNFGDLLGTQDLGDSSSLFFSDGGLGGFDGGFLIAGSKASCTCPHDIASDKGCIYAKPGGDPTDCDRQCCTYCCRDDGGNPLSTCRKVTDNPRCS